jgi:bifunctional non-homologous end joining protein LigD
MAEASSIKVGKRKLTITHPDKVLYPGGKFTKGDVVDYYVRLAPYLLPHFRDRPVTLKRYPDGVTGEAFYEKDAPAFTPEWVKTFPVPRREGGPDINYILINEVATLAWAANIAALELHPFLHRAPKIEQPTHVVFDLDPGEGTDILNCAKVALLLRDVLAKLKLESWAKVSGSKGVQVYVPLNITTSYDATQPFARAIAELLEREHADVVVSEMSKNLRRGKVFIDWSQNADHKTTVGVYSLRAKRHRPYVSMPVRWMELQAALKTRKIDNLYFEPQPALVRLKRVGDLFASVLQLQQKLPAQFTALAPRERVKRTSSFAEYEAKRDFARTREPAPNVLRRSRQGSRRRFVVQKHAASRLHYDLRLEMHNVLKSWAVPKGIPLKKGQTHSGFETEDHPVEYLEFEGTIPEAEYGGGTVMVWDIGSYEVLEGNYWKGELSIFLNGKKLRGAWNLRRTDSDKGKPRWLVSKIDSDAKPVSAKRDAMSALSGRTLEQITRNHDTAVWKSDRSRNKKTSSAEYRTTNLEPTGEKRLNRVSPHRRPKFVRPMKAILAAELPSGDEWIYEVKWDGYRALALKDPNDVRLLSLKEKNLTTDFPQVADAVRGVNADLAVIDGEIVAINEQGCPSFRMLQNRASLGRNWSIVFYAFDLLQLDDADLTKRPLTERKAKLREILEGSAVRYNAELSGSAKDVLRTVREAGLEGVVAKDRQSLYRAGTRVMSWRKLKLARMQEFVIGGYKPAGASFQSILAGYYQNRELMFAGKVRQGFNPASRGRLLQRMRPLLIAECPFANLPTSKKSHFGEGIAAEEMKELCWLKPKLVAQISFTEWTNYDLLRHATFEALRDDKEASEVRREVVA